jgi:UDP-4-amino-4,6-dideoxy-N-acetyl-beta-L-altrosamine transaminase
MQGLATNARDPAAASSGEPFRVGEMSEERFLNYGRHLIEEDDIAAVIEVLRGDLITQGPMVERLEHAVAERVQAKFAVMVNSGTSALHIACLAAGMQPGDRGVTSSITFVASANAMAYCGGEPSFLDIDGYSLGMSPKALEHHLRKHPETKIVMPVHFAGLAYKSAELRKIAGHRILIEDAAHTIGGTYEDGLPVGCGSYADMTVFSFHPVKTITTGEGGCVVTNDAELAHKLRLYRSHGIERNPNLFIAGGHEDGRVEQWYYEQQFLGYNYRITDIQAALGLSQLKKLDRFIERRRELVRFYDESFSDLNCVALPQSRAADRGRSAHHLYVALFDFAAIGKKRQQFLDEMRKHRVGAQVHYIPVYRQPFYAEREGTAPADFPVSESYYERCLSLPLFPDLTDREAERVVSTVRRAIGA